METLSDLVTETPKFLTSQSVAVKPYEAPHARDSSLEDSCRVYSGYSQAHAPSVHSNEAALETGKVLVPEKKKSEALEKSQTKESASKGLRKLLKFGKKSQSSSSTSEYHTESDNAAGNSNEDHGSAITAATTSEGTSFLKPFYLLVKTAEATVHLVCFTLYKFVALYYPLIGLNLHCSIRARTL